MFNRISCLIINHCTGWWHLNVISVSLPWLGVFKLEIMTSCESNTDTAFYKSLINQSNALRTPFEYSLNTSKYQRLIEGLLEDKQILNQTDQCNGQRLAFLELLSDPTIINKEK